MIQQLEIFKSNYSWETSLPPYRESKLMQAVKVLGCIKKAMSSLLEISDELGLPQSTIAGRCNDLIKEDKIKYSGFVFYKGRKRKRIVVNEC